MTRTTRAAAANLAKSMTSQMVGLNAENTDNVASTKYGVTRCISQGNALRDIGNKVSAITISDGTKKGAVKKGPMKKDKVQLPSQQHILDKNTATSSLKGSAEDNSVVQKEHAFACLEPTIPPLLKTEQPLTKFPKALEVPTVIEHSQQNVSASLDMSVGDAGADTFSKALFNIPDIDANDKDEPQLVSEYVNDIYSYMIQLQRKYTIQSNYLKGYEVTGKMRGILIDWLCQVHHRFDLLQETLYLTVAIIDRFLKESSISRNQFQLVGITAMLIASKYEEMYAPEVNDFVYISDNSYSKKEILEMERTMLRTLDFNLGQPSCLQFLRRNSKVGEVNINQHTLAKYLMELTITEYDMVQYLPSQIAAAALCLSMKLLGGCKWTDTLSHYSSYCEKELLPIMQKLASLVMKAETSKLTAVRTKYSCSKLLRISTLKVLKSSIVSDLAASCS